MLYNAKQTEEEILELWKKTDAFQKSIDSRPEDKRYAFYDGPPFATGLPHYGHFAPLVMKDAIPRYFTMRGYRVERKWGWDCHGLPVENMIEKELGLNSKKDIEVFGVQKFNEACRASVLRFGAEWKKTIHRMGRWVDMENDYKTMDTPYMESVWWVFSELWKKDLIYQGYKPMHICPRCVTPLSQNEVTEGYKDVKDISVIVKFKIATETSELISRFKLPNHLDGKYIAENPVYILAWTTTPWTLPGNVLLAVNQEIDYAVCDVDSDTGSNILVLAKDRVETVLKDKKYSVIAEVTGKDLVGLEYEPLFSYYKDTPNAFRVVAADFVSTGDGTGVVHIAPAFGEQDFYVGEEQKVPLVQHVGMDGIFKQEVTDFAGLEVKPKDDPTKTDIEVIKWLAHENKLFSKEKIEHSYPHCWRCDTPLLNYATTSWFVKVTAIKDQMLKNNEKIHWVPEHIKEGRFGKWLEGARDWAISRNRFWGAPLPVWMCESKEQGTKTKNQTCGNIRVIGSVAELEKLSGVSITDLHKHIIDPITFPCEKCGGVMQRIPEVLDCWFESGSMPYGELHYPFENKDKFENCFPAKFIAEGPDQTRGWFYTLHVLATALTSGDNASITSTRGSTPAFENVIVNGIVLAEDGKKMSKKLRNYPDPEIILNKYGADAVRYSLVTSPVMYTENSNFSEDAVKETYGKLINTLSNVLEFYQMFADDTSHHEYKSAHALDKWIVAKLHELIKIVQEKMELYLLAEASRPIVEFVTELSQWYVRRSRERLKGADEIDKLQCLSTLREVLLQLSKIMAPFTPFIAEKIYQELKQNHGGKKFEESVHLELWPKYHEKHHELAALNRMLILRKVVEIGLSIRAEQKIKVRQPLAKLSFCVGGSYTTIGNDLGQNKEYLAMIAEELNVKEVEYAEAVKEAGFIAKVDGDVKVWLNTEMTEELAAEGLLRDIIRTINQMRKDQGLTIEDKVVVKYFTESELLKNVLSKYTKELKQSVLAEEVVEGENDGAEVEIGKDMIKFSVSKV
jgi:isoleucyl-tRNA synthetase